MRETTKKRYERIRQAAAHMYGTMPAMKLYIALAEDFNMSDETIRQILGKSHKKHPGASFRFRKERPPPRMVIGIK